MVAFATMGRVPIWAALFAVACTGPARPRDVRAFVSAGAVEVSWEPAPLVTTYRVQLIDYDSGAPASAPVIVHGTHATLPGTASGVSVDAVPGARAMGVVSSGAAGGTGAPWQLFAPWDFRGGALTARTEQLGAGERMAVLLVNAGGPDGAGAEVTIDGASATASSSSVTSSAALQIAGATAPHEIVRAREALLAGGPVAAAEGIEGGDHRSFCIVPGLDFSR